MRLGLMAPFEVRIVSSRCRLVRRLSFWHLFGPAHRADCLLYCLTLAEQSAGAGGWHRLRQLPLAAAYARLPLRGLRRLAPGLAVLQHRQHAPQQMMAHRH